MPKMKWDVSSDEPEALSGFDEYVGPDLPRGVFKFKVVLIRVAENKNGEAMLKTLLQVHGMTGAKKKYNGAPLWVNQNVTEQGKPYLMKFLDALGVTWQEFNSQTVTDDSEPPNITKIGKTKINGENLVVATTKIGSYQGEKRAELSQFLPAGTDLPDDDGDTGSISVEDPDATPKAGKKAKKDKGAKGSKADADEPPF